MELVNEYKNIMEAIEYYIQGAIQGKGDVMKQGFHSAAQIYGYLDGNLLADPIQALFDYVDANPPATELEYSIDSITRSGSSATARIELDNWNGNTYTDFFTLLKIEDRWKITNKVFMQH